MNRLKRILWPRSQAWRGALLIGGALASLIMVFVLLNLGVGSAGKLKDIAAIIQSSVTVVAIVAGGIFAYYKLQLFRDLEPHLTITHEVSRKGTAMPSKNTRSGQVLIKGTGPRERSKPVESTKPPGPPPKKPKNSE